VTTANVDVSSRVSVHALVESATLLGEVHGVIGKTQFDLSSRLASNPNERETPLSSGALIGSAAVLVISLN
jgi:hypothetical protein